MKNIATLVLTTFSLLATINCQSQKTLINKDELPQTSQRFISDNFPDYTLDYIIKKVKITKTEYKVRFREGLKIEFDEQGNWKEIDGKKMAIQTKFIQKKIANLITEKFPNTDIIKVEREKYGTIEVKLSNSLELMFSSEGDFLGIDD